MAARNFLPTFFLIFWRATSHTARIFLRVSHLNNCQEDLLSTTFRLGNQTKKIEIRLPQSLLRGEGKTPTRLFISLEEPNDAASNSTYPYFNYRRVIHSFDLILCEMSGLAEKVYLWFESLLGLLPQLE